MYFNFAFYYNLLIKNNTPLKQYDAVYILLLGQTRSDYQKNNSFHDGYIEISDSARTNYICGADRIRQEILLPLLNTPLDEYIRRLKMLQIPDIQSTFYSLKKAALEYHFTFDFPFSNVESSDDAYHLLAIAFQKCLQCPKSSRLSKESMKHLQLIREKTCSDPEINDPFIAHAFGTFQGYLGSISPSQYMSYQQKILTSDRVIVLNEDKLPDISLMSVKNVPYWKFYGTFNLMQTLIFEQKIFNQLPGLVIYIDMPPNDDLNHSILQTIHKANISHQIPFVIRTCDISRIEIVIFLNPIQAIANIEL